MIMPSVLKQRSSSLFYTHLTYLIAHHYFTDDMVDITEAEQTLQPKDTPSMVNIPEVQHTQQPKDTLIPEVQQKQQPKGKIEYTI